VVCYIEVLSKEWFSSLWFVIKKFCQRSGSRHCGLLYRSFVKGVVLVIVVSSYIANHNDKNHAIEKTPI
jgi:hypothetical protein